MVLRSGALQALFAALMGAALALLGGCVYREAGPPEAHFKSFESKPPEGDRVTVCHAYGCKAQTPFTFTPSDIAELSALMASVPRDDSPREERRAMAYAIGWMERRVAPTVGTANDRPSMDFGGSGDSTQQDCVDEATNTTSYLLVLQANGKDLGSPEELDAAAKASRGRLNLTVVNPQDRRERTVAVDLY